MIAETKSKKRAAGAVTKDIKTATAKVLVLRTCDAAMRSHGGFLWPASGMVEAKDWLPSPECGHGLHGLLWGEGDGSLLSWSPDARWLVAEVDQDTIVDLGGKVKFPRANVVFCGDRQSAIAYLLQNGANGKAVVGITATAGDSGTATAGHGGTATAGHDGTATAGVRGTATAGDGGTATAGDGGTARAGYDGTATAGDGGTAMAGDGGVIVCRWWDMAAQRHRLTVGYPGESGIRPGVKYHCDETGKLVEAV